MKSSVALIFPLVWAGATAAQETLVRARVTRAVDPEKLVTLPAHTHPLARPEFDQGAAAESQPIRRMQLVLQRGADQEAALQRLLDDQQVSSSPRYHQWLTPQQFGQRFGPADADIQAVTDWLSGQGFEVNRVASGRTVIEFSGTAGLLRQALHTEIHKYLVSGEEHWANASNPRIPEALAPVVAGIASLNNFRRKPMLHRLGTFRRTKATGEVKPLFTFPEGGMTTYAVGPADFGTIYNVLPLWNGGIDGTAQAIAIAGQSNINMQDVRAFRSMFGLPAKDPQIILNGPDPGILDGDEGESDLDVEWAGAVAKGATIDLVVSESTEASPGADLSALYIIDENLAPVMSESYGTCEADLGAGGNAFYNALWEQAAAQGITAFVAAGDNGSAECDGLSGQTAAQSGLAVSGLASTPFNVAVGGTDFDDVSIWTRYWNPTNDSSQASAKSYIPETTWNDSCARSGKLMGCLSVARDGSDLVAGGGGPSTCAMFSGTACLAGYQKPAWQAGSGVPNDGVRDSPDVSLFASDGLNGSFYVFCQMDANTGANTSSCDLNAPYQDFQGAGGTSFAAPAFAGIMALVNQSTGQRQGNANYVLYALAALNISQNGASGCDSSTTATSNSTCIFYDTTKGNISVACRGGTLDCSNRNTARGQYGVLVTPSSASTLAWLTSAGYDLASGLGTVNAANLVKDWTKVGFNPTSTTLQLSPTTITHGQQVNVTAKVVAQNGGAPTGDVSLIGDPGSPPPGITFFTLANGSLAATTNLLPGGTYKVTAHYAGDGARAASDSAPVQVTVNKESSATKVSLVTFDFTTGATTNSNATTAPYGSPFVLRVDVTNASGTLCVPAPPQAAVYACPSGTVTTTDNGQPLDLGTYKLNSQGNLEDQLLQPPGGLHNIMANYAGDNSYNSSISPVDAITITPAPTSTTVTPPAPAQAAQPVSLIVGISTQSSGVAPTGTVQLFKGSTPTGNPAACAGTPFMNGSYAQCQASPSVTLTASATFTARYSGDSNYAASTSAPFTVTVAPDFSLSSSPTSNIITAGRAATYTISATGSNGFASAVSLTCSVANPAGITVTSPPTCALSPSSITPSQTPASSTLTVNTTAKSLGPPADFIRRVPVNGLPLLSALLLLLAMWMYFASARHRHRWAGAAVAVLTGLVIVGMVSCGGGGSSGGGGGGGTPGTTAGQYTVTVTGKSGTTSHSTQVILKVQ